MDWLDRMNSAMDYIEENLATEISYDEIAKRALCGSGHFQRMFPFITGVTLSDYIRRRRLTLAAFDLQEADAKVIDVALKYGYDSPEAFSRAFRGLHGVMPSALKKYGASVYLKAFPRITFTISIRGETEMNYRIEKKEAFEMCGFSVEISTINGENFLTIPKFWEESMTNGAIDGLRKALGIAADVCVHGAMYNFREDAFTYMICHDAPKNGAIKGYEKLCVGEYTWAIFETDEHAESEISPKIQSLWKRIYPEWFPNSGYEHACGPEFEMYFHKGGGRYVSQVWIPVRKK